MNTSSSKNSNTALSGQVLNKLRAAVLGANDGIVSTSAIIMGVAGATDSTGAIFTAGLAAIVAGALSMAVGEYVSVSSQSDAEKAFIAKEKHLLETDPEGQFEELVAAYRQRGINEATARQVATELTDDNALRAHLVTEFGMEEEDIVSPMQAAIASLFSFTLGGLIPFVTILVAPHAYRLWATAAAVVIALCVTGYTSATIGNANRGRAVLRVLVGGIAAMVITYYVGVLFGTAVG